MVALHRDEAPADAFNGDMSRRRTTATATATETAAAAAATTAGPASDCVIRNYTSACYPTDTPFRFSRVIQRSLVDNNDDDENDKDEEVMTDSSSRVSTIDLDAVRRRLNFSDDDDDDYDDANDVITDSSSSFSTIDLDAVRRRLNFDSDDDDCREESVRGCAAPNVVRHTRIAQVSSDELAAFAAARSISHFAGYWPVCDHHDATFDADCAGRGCDGVDTAAAHAQRCSQAKTRERPHRRWWRRLHPKPIDHGACRRFAATVRDKVERCTRHRHRHRQCSPTTARGRRP